MLLPELPEGYSWWIDEYDLRILQHGHVDDYWTSWSIYNEYEDKPDHDGRFYTATEEVQDQEFVQHDYFLFFKKNRVRHMRGTRITNVRTTVVSRLEYYDSMFLSNRRESQEHTVEMWRRIKSDGPNSLANLEGRARALFMRFEAVQQNGQLKGHYPPKKIEDVS